MNTKELATQTKDVDHYMASKGLGYTATRNYEAHQIFCAARDAGNYTSTVLARLRTGSGHDYFSWGFYPRDEAEAVARKVKRSRKYWVIDVIVIDGARSF